MHYLKIQEKRQRKCGLGPLAMLLNGVEEFAEGGFIHSFLFAFLFYPQKGTAIYNI